MSIKKIWLIVAALVTAGVVLVAGVQAVPQAVCIDTMPFDGALVVRDEWSPVAANICSSTEVIVDGVPAGNAGDNALYNYQAEIPEWLNPHTVDTGGFDYSAEAIRLVPGEEFVRGSLFFAPTSDVINLIYYPVYESSSLIRHIVAVKGYAFDSEGYTHFWKYSLGEWASASDYSWEDWEEPFLFSYVENVNPADDQCLNNSVFGNFGFLMLDPAEGVLGVCSSVQPMVNGLEAEYAGDQLRWNYTSEVTEGNFELVVGEVTLTGEVNRVVDGETLEYQGITLTGASGGVNALMFRWNGWDYVQATGFGFTSSGYTHMWDWNQIALVEGSSWDTSGLGQNYLVKQIPQPTPTPQPTEVPGPTPTPQPGVTPSPTPEPTTEPGSHTVHMPFVAKNAKNESPVCWEVNTYPFIPFFYPLDDHGMGACSPQVVVLDGRVMGLVLDPRFNYLDTNIRNGNHVVAVNDTVYNIHVQALTPGLSYVDDWVKITANEFPVNIIRIVAIGDSQSTLDDVYGFETVYIVTGDNYRLEQEDWADQFLFWDEVSQSWTGDYDHTTIMGVHDR